jgi:hypothetical protein
MSGSEPVVLYPWMRPAWWLGRLRPGLRAATAADAARLRELPPAFGRIILPALAVALPILLAIGHATTIPWTAPPPNLSPALLVIYDIFTESLPFMAAAAVVGLVSPAAGVLLTIVYALGNFGVTVWSGELKPVPGAAFGRLVTYLVLWLLVVEIPLLGRMVFEWWSSRDDSPREKRSGALIASALTIAALVYIWALAAPLLNVIVFLLAGREPPSLPTQVLAVYDGPLAAALGIATLAIFMVRYFGPLARVARAEHEPASAGRPASLPAYLGSLAVTMLVLSSVIRKPVDALVLLGGLLVARPVARGILRVTRLARVLAGVAWPIRLIAGFALSLGFAWYFLAIAGVSLISPFFNMVIAIAVGLIIIEVFVAADEVVATPRGTGGRFAAGLGTGALLLLSSPAVALADNTREHADMDDVAAAQAAAASAAGAAAFYRRTPPRKLPEYSGPPGQDSGGPGHGGGPSKEPAPYSGPQGQDSGGPPKLPDYTPPGSPTPPPPKWYDKYVPDFFG